jgi:hypothetical protein
MCDRHFGCITKSLNETLVPMMRDKSNVQACRVATTIVSWDPPKNPVFQVLTLVTTNCMEYRQLSFLKIVFLHQSLVSTHQIQQNRVVRIL